MRQIPWKALLLVSWALLSLLSAAALLNAQRQGENDMRQRFGVRVDIAARFTETSTG